MSVFLPERRRAVRVTYVCDVEVLREDSQAIQQRLNDISTSGAFIDTTSPSPVGTVLQVRFPMNGVLIEARAEVRFAMSQIGMGVRFIELSPEHQRIIRNYVEERALAGAAAPVKPLPSPLVETTPALPPLKPSAYPTSTAVPNAVLSGSFAFLSIFDVVQMIDSSRLTGILEISMPQEHGAIYFNNGLIVGATSGSESDGAALAGFLSATEGTFAFQQSEAAHPVTLTTSSNTGLLLDLLTEQDEERASTLVEA